jgi:hypothetical protein
MSQIEDELRQRAQQWAVSTAIAQGLPPKVEDPVVLARVALLLGDCRTSSATRYGLRGRRPNGRERPAR